MARNPSAFAKRQRELERQKKRSEKRKRREDRSLRRERRAASESDVDPDIAGIVPGPQPLPYDEDGLTIDHSQDEDDEDLD